MSLDSRIEVAAEIAKLSCLSVLDLRAEWPWVIGGTPPKSARREYLLRAIAYRLQCGSHGGLPTALARSLLKLCPKPQVGSVGEQLPTRTLKPGARILREWQGAVHEVEIVDNGYRYRNCAYKSLSVIARQA